LVDGAFLFRRRASHFDDLPTQFDLFWSILIYFDQFDLFRSVWSIYFDPFLFWHQNCQNISIARWPFRSISIQDQNRQNKASQASCTLSTWLHVHQPFVIPAPSWHFGELPESFSKSRQSFGEQSRLKIKSTGKRERDSLFPATHPAFRGPSRYDTQSWWCILIVRVVNFHLRKDSLTDKRHMTIVTNCPQLLSVLSLTLVW
jgi:hypothetical protein